IVGVGAINYLYVYDNNGNLKASTEIMDIQYDHTYIGNDILVIEDEPIKELPSYSVYRLFGKKMGTIKMMVDGISDMFRVMSVIKDGDGEIVYEGGEPEDYVDNRLWRLEYFVGRDYLPNYVFITLQGDWENSPVFRDVNFKLKVYNAVDTLVYTNVIPLTLSNSESFTFVDTLDSLPSGDYIIKSVAVTDSGQVVTMDNDYFTVLNEGINFVMGLDRDAGFQGDTFTVFPVCINADSIQSDSIRLVVSGDSLYLDTLFEIEGNGVDSFPIRITPDTSIIITGKVMLSSGDSIVHKRSLLIAGKNIDISITAPEFIDFKPFGVKTTLFNESIGGIDAVVKRIFSGDTIVDTVYIESGGEWSTIDSFTSFTSDTFRTVVITGERESSKGKHIKVGIDGDIKLDSSFYVSPEDVKIQSFITNTGVFDTDYRIIYWIGSQKNKLQLKPQRKWDNIDEFVNNLVLGGCDTSEFYILTPSGETDTISPVFNSKEPGDYTLNAFLFAESSSVLLDSASSIVHVLSNNQIMIDSIIISDTCVDTIVPVYVTIENKSVEGFEGVIKLSTGNFYSEKIFGIEGSEKDTVIFNLSSPIPEGRYPVKAEIVGKCEKEVQKNFVPIYSIRNILPIYSPSGGWCEIDPELGNTGNGEGERVLKMEWADVVNLEKHINIPVGRDTSFIDSFPVPEDMPGGIYYCRLSVLNDGFPEVDTFIPVYVDGIRITAWDSLDRAIYLPGDTVHLYVKLMNHSTWGGNLYSQINYGGTIIDTTFILCGGDSGVIYYGDTLWLASGGYYLFSPEEYSYDSVRVTFTGESVSVFFRTDTVPGGGVWTEVDTTVYYPADNWLQFLIRNRTSS
ncbi:hypothetical protein DRQ23_09540, partial [bacterium]